MQRQPRPDVRLNSGCEGIVGSVSRAHHDERLDDLGSLGVRFADHRDLGDRRMLDDRTLDVGGTDPITGRGDDVIVAA